MSNKVKGTQKRTGPISAAKTPARGRETDALIERAAKGDKTCLPQIQELLSDSHCGEALVDLAGSSARALRQAVAERAAGENLLVVEAVKLKIDKLQAELEGPNPSAIERLLAERAAVCWFIVNYHEERAIRSASPTIAQADFSQRRVDRAHKRFLSAVETLARVRKLAVPSLMVNIAKNQQVNVTGIPDGE